MSQRVFIADDHPIVLAGVASLVGTVDGFEVVGTARDGDTALSEIIALAPSLVVLDLNMPRRSGLDVVRALPPEQATRAIILAATIEPGQIYDCVNAGVSGLLLKEAAATELVDCMRSVAAGGTWLPQETVTEPLAAEVARRERADFVASRLTQRELEVMRLLAEGQSNKEIAFQLGLSEGTVKIHLNNVFRKLGVSSRAAAAALIRGAKWAD